MNSTLKEEKLTNQNYRSKTLKDIETQLNEQRDYLAPYTQEKIQNTISTQIQELHETLLDQRKKEQQSAFHHRLIDIAAILCCLVPTLLSIWFVWGR